MASKNRFIVDLGRVKLTDKARQRVEASIQKAAVAALADIDFRGDLITRFPREWLGIWIDVGKGLPINDKEIIKFSGL